MTIVSGVLLDHVDEDPAQRHMFLPLQHIAGDLQVS